MTDKSPQDPYFRGIVERSLEGADQIAKMTKEDAARLPEAAFVNHLLPILANRESGQQALTVWQDVAGHAMRPIDVVDNTTGDVLFRVPPILSSEKTHYERGKGESTGDILATGELKSQIHHNLGSSYVWGKLQERIVKEPVSHQDVRQWDAILKRYGYGGLIPEGKEPEAEKQTSATEGFSGEYDEL